MTQAKRFLKLQSNGDYRYYKFEHDVVLLFGLTELKAHITWTEGVSEAVIQTKCKHLMISNQQGGGEAVSHHFHSPMPEPRGQRTQIIP